MEEVYSKDSPVARLMGLSRETPGQIVDVSVSGSSPNIKKSKQISAEIAVGETTKLAVMPGQIVKCKASYPEATTEILRGKPQLFAYAVAANIGVIGLAGIASLGAATFAKNFLNNGSPVNSIIKKTTGVDISKSKFVSVFINSAVIAGLWAASNHASKNWEEKTKTKVPDLKDLWDLVKELTGFEGLGDIGL